MQRNNNVDILFSFLIKYFIYTFLLEYFIECDLFNNGNIGSRNPFHFDKARYFFNINFKVHRILLTKPSLWQKRKWGKNEVLCFLQIIL